MRPLIHSSGVLGRYPPLAPFGAGVLMASLYVVFGTVLTGLGKSPYIHTPYYILYNSVLSLALVAGEEALRTSFIWRTGYRRPALAILMSTLLIMAVYLNPSQVEGLTSGEGVRNFASWAFPLLSVNLAAGVASLYYGYIGSVSLRLPTALAWVMMPVLPNVYTTDAILVHVIVAVIVITFLSMTAQPTLGSPLTLADRLMIGLSILAVVGVWLSHGLLGYYALVVLSGSMEPELERGDIVIVSSVDPGDVKLGM